jgi:hypothetical protein
MKKQKSIHTSTPLKESFSSEDRLGRFFALLLQIDQRNNSGLYESNKNRDRTDSSTGRPYSVR